MANMRDRIDAPPLVPPRYGLLTAAPVVDDSARWFNGVEYQPEGCGISGVFSEGCESAAPDADVFRDLHGPAPLGFDSFSVWAADRCTTLQSTRDYVGRARRALLAEQSYQVAHELWHGTLTQDRHADPADRTPYLMDGGATALGTATPDIAVGILDAAFGSCARGRRGMIHVTPASLPHILSNHGTYVYRDGTMLLTQLGTIVVVDPGYGPDVESVADAAAEDALTAYVTPIVGVRLDEVVVTPPPAEDGGPASAVERTKNTITWMAQRIAMYQFDAACCRYSIILDV